MTKRQTVFINSATLWWLCVGFGAILIVLLIARQLYG